jgi:RNA polymerase sigma-B factor
MPRSSPVAMWRSHATTTATDEKSQSGMAMMPARAEQWRTNAAEPVPASAAAVGREDSRGDSRGDSLLLALNALAPGDPARTEIRASAIEWYLPLAGHLARRYVGRGEPPGDLTQIATIGLIKAIDRFDVSRNVPFASYAAPTILGEIKRYFRDATWTIRVPRPLQEARVALQVATEHLTRQLQRVPRTTDLAAALGLSTSDVDAARQVGSAYRPLSQPRMSADGEMISALDLVGGPDPEFEAVDRRLSLRPLLAALSERDRRVIALRFIDELTQTEIGLTLGISQMHVSRLLARSLATLRDQMIADGG